ncbi:MAG: phosphoglucosamine mutase [Bacillota bacterium]|nr:phosphoglucosamine mutase [Bacillota bacterium]
MGKLFGTDGIRGVANRDLTPELAFKIGRIAAWLLGNEVKAPTFIIGRDTRLSGPMLEGALAAGINSAGGAVRLLGIVSTPAVAYLTRELKASAGVVISASHNPIEDNGLKIFNNRGYKLSDALEAEIENIYFENRDQIPRPEGAELGRSFSDGETLRHYLDYLKTAGSPLSGFKLVVDCAHGAACRIAGDVLEELGATVKMLHNEPDGCRINVHCGATDTAELQQEVTAFGALAGLAFDGDADRLIAVDEKGCEVDGDAVMSICAINLAAKGQLKKNTLVTTVMSNGGLDILGEKYGFEVIRTAVGDRYVLEKMLAGGYNIGGEQSGHIIFSDYATTGDGLLTALQLLKVMHAEQRPLSELASRLERLPQVLVNQRVTSKEGWSENKEITSAIKKIEQKLGNHGRVLIRPSGTEPKIRIMLEAPLPQEKLEQYAHSLAEVIAREQS